MTLNSHDNPAEIINRYNTKSIQEAIYNDIPPVQQYSQIPSHSHSVHQSYTNIPTHIPQRLITANHNTTDSEEFMRFLNRTLAYSPLKIFKEFIISLNRKLSACCEKCRVDIFQVFENSSEYSVANATTEPPTEKVKCDVMDFLQQLYEAGRTSTTSTTTPVPTTTSTTTETPMISRDNLKPVLVDLLHHLYAFSKSTNNVDSEEDEEDGEEECIDGLCETTITTPVKKSSKKTTKSIH